MRRRRLQVEKLGVVAYDLAMELQDRAFSKVLSGLTPDTLLLLEHPHVFTIGRGADSSFIHSTMGPEGEVVAVRRANRGGQVTYHGPGQVVLYPVINLRRLGLGVVEYVWLLEEAIIRALAKLDVKADRRAGYRGVWIGARKIASIGIGVSHGVSRHGIAVNVTTDLRYFQCMDPCGLVGVEMTSIERELECAPNLGKVQALLVEALAEVMSYDLSGRPEWIKVSYREAATERTAKLLDRLGVSTVCREARCPNLGECWRRGSATFLLLGDLCTRRCGYCAVRHGIGANPDPQEPLRVTDAAVELELSHVVLTSVGRDDLPDGGAGHFAATVEALRRRLPACSVEALVPDFQGASKALELLVRSSIEIFAHNVETVPRLYRAVRPGSRYYRCLELLAQARHARSWVVKSGMMVGLGERIEEVIAVMRDLRRVGCDVVTIGQYLRPSRKQLPVRRYLPPEEFASLREVGLDMGFAEVESGALVRSSYRAWRHLGARAKKSSGGLAPAQPSG